MKKGPNYRELHTINFIKAFDTANSAIDNYIQKNFLKNLSFIRIFSNLERRNS